MIHLLFKPISTEAFVGKRTLGIHIQENRLCIVGLQKKTGQEELFTDAEVIEFKNQELSTKGNTFISQQIKSAVKTFKTPYKDVCVTVSDSALTTEQMMFPLMSSTELLSAIRVKLETTVGPTFDKEYYWDFIPLHHLSKSEQNVLIVLVKRDALDKQLKILTDADLQPIRVDFLPHAYSKSIQYIPKEQGHGHALLYVEPNHVHIAVFLAQALAFYRCLPKNLRGVFNHFEIQKESPLSPDHSLLIQGLVSEIQQSFEYSIEHKCIPDIQHIFIAGDFTTINQLSSLLSEHLEKPIELATPAASITLPSALGPVFHTHRLQLILATGCTQEGLTLSLLPDRFKAHAHRYDRPAIFRRIAYMCSILILALVGLSAWYRFNINHQLQVNQGTFTTLQNTLMELTRTQAFEQQLSQEHQELIKASGVYIPLHHLMFEVSKIIPERLILTQMSYAQEFSNLDLEGVAYYGKGEAEQKLALFLSSIETSLYFSHVRLAYFKRKTEAATSYSTFLIQVTASPPEPPKRSPANEIQSQ